MVDIAYLKDVRTDEEYKTDVEAGIYNQKVAANQLVADMKAKGWDIYVEWTDKNEQYQDRMENIAPYHPDAILHLFKGIWEIYGYNCEIKVAFYETPFFYLKNHQIGKLVSQRNAYIFFATPTQFAIVPVRWIVENSEKVKMWDKDCLKILSSKITRWHKFSQRLTLKPSHSKI